MSKPVIGATKTNTPDVMAFNSRTQLTSLVTEDLLRGQTDPNQCPIMTALIGMEGIVSVSVRPYCAYVQKNAMFTWDELAPKIIGHMLHWHNLFGADDKDLAREVQTNVSRKPRLTLHQREDFAPVCSCGCTWAVTSGNDVLGCARCVRAKF